MILSHLWLTLKKTLDSVTVNNPFPFVVLNDVNAKLSIWYNENITASEGSRTGSVTSQLRLLRNKHEFKQKWCIYSQTSKFIARRLHFYKVIMNLNINKKHWKAKVKNENPFAYQSIMVINTTEQKVYKSKIYQKIS